jgi:hypothetical protein
MELGAGGPQRTSFTPAAPHAPRQAPRSGRPPGRRAPPRGWTGAKTRAAQGPACPPPGTTASSCPPTARTLRAPRCLGNRHLVSQARQHDPDLVHHREHQCSAHFQLLVRDSSLPCAKKSDARQAEARLYERWWWGTAATTSHIVYTIRLALHCPISRVGKPARRSQTVSDYETMPLA